MSAALLEVDDLHRHFPSGRRTLRAVDGVSLRIAAGEVLGLLGESGSGKSTLGLTIAQLHRPTSGAVRFAGEDLSRLGGRALRTMRRRLQVIFQDPSSSLDPRMSAGELIGEPLLVAGMPQARRRERVAELLGLVGLDAAFADRYSFELSGGQRQRIGIARALAAEAELLICDEPISALDVSIQAQIMNLLLDLRERLGLSMLFISHDVAAVVHMSDRIAVMYLGKLVEIGPGDGFVAHARHPYTRALLAAVPDRDLDPSTEPPLRGEIADAAALPSGCRFRTRCAQAAAICSQTEPPLRTMPDGGSVACHMAE
jgi:oligopeptide/dipeptide ABC transporter ATP-binding protein